MANPVGVYPLAKAIVRTGGQPIDAAFGPLLGGFIQNPFDASDQGLVASEPIYVDITGPAATEETATTQAIQPGALFTFPAGLTTTVSVNAKSAGHKIAGLVLQPAPPFPPTPQSGSFPPSGPTTLTKIIPSYLYQEYNDDAACAAFVSAYNSLAQGYVDWFVGTPLPVYSDPSISGSLLNWVAAGLYGMIRPTLSSGRNRRRGPYNTWAFNTIPFNISKIIGPTNITVTTDDVFKRILTWNLYRGDGNAFSIRWLKRRIMRFLTGPNGSAPNVDNTSPISVTTGSGIIAIAINVGTRSVLGGALYNRFGFNRMAYNRLLTQFVPGPTQLPLVNVLKEAIESGVLQLPFQYQFVVSI